MCITVYFYSIEDVDAESAITQFDGKDFNGMKIKVQMAMINGRVGLTRRGGGGGVNHTPIGGSADDDDYCRICEKNIGSKPMLLVHVQKKHDIDPEE